MGFRSSFGVGSSREIFVILVFRVSNSQGYFGASVFLYKVFDLNIRWWGQNWESGYRIQIICLDRLKMFFHRIGVKNKFTVCKVVSLCNFHCVLGQLKNCTISGKR